MLLAQTIISLVPHISRPRRKCIKHAPSAAKTEPECLRLEPKPVPRSCLLTGVGEPMAVPAGKKTVRVAVDPGTKKARRPGGGGLGSSRGIRDQAAISESLVAAPLAVGLFTAAQGSRVARRFNSVNGISSASRPPVPGREV
jgi:hypothetical protein